MEKPKQSLKIIESNYRATFQTDAGKLVIEDLKLTLGHGKTLYSNKQTSEELHFQMGRQSVIHDILFMLSNKIQEN